MTMLSKTPLSRTLAAGACLGALALAGCTTVGPNYKPPAVPENHGYAQPGDIANRGQLGTEVGAKVLDDWWTLFQSPGLNKLMAEAIANNLTLKAAQARLAEATDAQAAQGGLLTADLNASYKRERANLIAFSGGAFSPSALPGGLSFPTNPEYNLYSLGGSVSYNFDLFGGQRRLRESLKAQTDEQRHELEAAYLTLTGKVVEQVLTVADADIQAKALQAIADSDRQDLDMILKAREAGGASEADVVAARQQLALDSSAVPAQKQRLAAARHAMAVLVGKAPSEYDAPYFGANSGALPAALPVSIPSELVHQRPDILEAEAKLHQATAEIGIADANFYPNITLNGVISQDALTPQTIFNKLSNSYNFGPALTLPIFHSGELHARKRQAEDNARAAALVYEETVLEAFAQVDDSLQAIAHDNQAYSDQQRVLDLAQARLDMVRKSFAAGGVTARQLLAAQKGLVQAQLDLQQNGTGRYADAAKLMLAVAHAPNDLGQPRPKTP
jgi:NodT family efflux transporter outer membrane factor (OMF) lipoprotein